MLRKNKLLLLIAFAVLFSLLLCQITSAETLQEKKLVYVVLDDSGSMINENRWPKALYSLEVLCGLLNPEDRMELYYLNDTTHWTAALDNAGIQDTIKKIVHTGGPNGKTTAFKRVNDAFADLLSVSKRGQYDKYWLVAVTDGAYLDQTDIGKSFRNFAGKFSETGEGNKFRLIYLTIGNDDHRIIIDSTKQEKDELNKLGIFCYDSLDKKSKTDHIIETMGEVADLVSGRSRFTGERLIVENGNTVKVRSDFPLFNFVVIAQGTDARLVTVSNTDGELTISRSAEFVPPTKSAIADFTETLSGSIYTVDNGKNNIGPDTYTLTFDQPVGTDQIIVLVEPALEVRLNHFVNGNAVDDPRSIASVGDSYSVSAEVYEAGTQKKIDLEKLPSGSKLVVTVENGKILADTETDVPAEIPQLEDDRVWVRAALSLPELNEIEERMDFLPNPEPSFTVTVPEDYLKEHHDNVLRATIEELKPGQKEKYLLFKIETDANSSQSLQSYLDLGKLLIKTDLPDYEVNCSGNGLLHFYPRYTDPSIALNVPHRVTLETSKGEVLAEGQVIITESTYEMTVDPNKTVTISTAELRDKGQTFTFTLKADGKTVKTGDYDRDIEFTEILKGSALSTETNPDNWKVSLPYEQGMVPGSYEIQAIYKGTPLKLTAKLELQTVAYQINVKPEALSIPQSKLPEALSDAALEISILDGKTPVSPDGLEWVIKSGDAEVPSDVLKATSSVDPNDPDKKMHLKVSGALSTDPGEYSLVLSYKGFDGGITEKTIPVSVTKSAFLIEPVSDRSLVFRTPSEMESNNESYHFEISVDGRPLTEAEMKLTSVSVEPDPNAAIIKSVVTPSGSGYDVIPTAAHGWKPSENNIEYTVTCIAPDTQETLHFYYQLMNYEVKCVDGDGREIMADALIDNQEGLDFRIYGDGEPLAYNTVVQNYTIGTDPSFQKVTLEEQVTVDPDGGCTVHIVPKSDLPKFFDFFARLWRPHGEMKVTLQFLSGEDIKGSGTINIKGGNIIFHLFPWLTAAAIIGIIGTISYLLITKERFGNKAYIYYVPCNQSNGRIKGKPGITGWVKVKLKKRVKWQDRINPFIRKDCCTINIAGLKVQAEGNHMIRIFARRESTIRKVDGVNPQKVPNISIRNESDLQGSDVFMNNGMAIAVHEVSPSHDVVIYLYSSN